MIIYLLAVIILLLLVLLYRTLPNRKIFGWFCLTLLLTGFIAYYGYPREEPAPLMTEEEKYAVLQQQQAFITWNANYQKIIDQLDYNWQSYHNILENFKSDNISIQTAYLRLRQLEDDSRQLKEEIAGMTPPEELNDDCFDQLASVLQKTSAYAAAQHRTIALTKAAADPQNLRSDQQEEQSRDLQTIMLRESPTGLFTAKEITAIRDALTLPEEEKPPTK